jgi:hypothetical protein
MKKIIALLLVVAMISGCTGSFALTKKVNEFHRSIKDKWVDEIVFLVCAFFPVYSIAILADVVLVNSIEFWSGENPLASSSAGKSVKVAMAGEYKAVMSYDKYTDTIKVDAFKGVIPVKSFVLARDTDRVILKDAEGQVLCYSTKNADGGMSLYDGKGKLAKHFTPEAVQIAVQKRLGSALAKK